MTLSLDDSPRRVVLQATTLEEPPGQTEEQLTTAPRRVVLELTTR